MRTLDARTISPPAPGSQAVIDAALLGETVEVAERGERPVLFLRSAGRAPTLGERAAPSRWMGYRAVFIILVLLPTAAAAVYLFAMATDQFVSEAHFVVRGAQKQNLSGLGAMLQSTGLSGVHDDSFSVVDFIRSRDALRELESSVPFREIVNRPGADFLARFPAFYTEGTFEDLFDHYARIVTVVHDATTGINTLKVRAFTADDSQRVSETLLRASEHFVNRLNERSLGDAVALASGEVAKAERRSSAAQQALTAYRILVGLVDTTSTARSYVELVGGLERELSATRAQLTQVQSATPSSPVIQSLRDRASALEQQITAERRKTLGSDGGVVGTFAEFERRTIEAEFAAKALVVANTMLETARMEALRKQLYLDRVVEPNNADRSRYPRRWLGSLTVFGTTMLCFSILWLIGANAREHAS